MIDPLSRLAIRHGADIFGQHDYAPVYHRLFAARRNRPLRLLVIGVGGHDDPDRGGQTLAMWAGYFPKAEITGLDPQEKRLDLGPRVRIRRGGQTDPALLAGLVAERGPFDIVIDDGSHQNAHVVESFRLLWPTLAPGGIYVAEDLQTAFHPRFGGSLELAEPNSVGFFASLARSFWEGRPDAAEVAGIERAHGLVAVHRRDAAGRAPGFGASPIFREETGATTLPPSGPEALRGALERLGERGLVVLESVPEGDTADFLLDLFVEIDHREIAFHHPGAGIDPLAPMLRGLEIWADGTILRRRSNDYPSSCAMDYRHPRVRAAIAAMERELSETYSEPGCVQLAQILTLRDGRAAARPWLDRLEREGATAPEVFQMAAGLARGDRDLPRAERLLVRALALRPADRQATLSLVGVLIALHRAAEAVEALRPALAARPRDVALHLAMARALARDDRIGPAIRHAAEALALSPPARAAQCHLALAELQIQAGQHEEAAATLAPVLGTESRFTPKAWRLTSTLRERSGDRTGALAAIEAALRADPGPREWLDWRARLSA